MDSREKAHLKGLGLRGSWNLKISRFTESRRKEFIFLKRTWKESESRGELFFSEPAEARCCLLSLFLGSGGPVIGELGVQSPGLCERERLPSVNLPGLPAPTPSGGVPLPAGSPSRPFLSRNSVLPDWGRVVGVLAPFLPERLALGLQLWPPAHLGQAWCALGAPRLATANPEGREQTSPLPGLSLGHPCSPHPLWARPVPP